MEKDIQQGRTCKLELDPGSASALNYGKEMEGKVLGRDRIDASTGSLNEMYPTQKPLTVIVIEGEAGIKWRIPERDIIKIVCGEEALC